MVKDIWIYNQVIINIMAGYLIDCILRWRKHFIVDGCGTPFYPELFCACRFSFPLYSWSLYICVQFWSLKVLLKKSFYLCRCAILYWLFVQMITINKQYISKQLLKSRKMLLTFRMFSTKTWLYLCSHFSAESPLVRLECVCFVGDNWSIICVLLTCKFHWQFSFVDVYWIKFEATCLFCILFRSWLLN